MADDVINRIEKHMEGNTLALTAVAEVLQKMDDRFVREDETYIAKQEEDQAHDARTAMVKAIASEVYGMMKADQGMDVDGTKVRSGTKAKGQGEDKEYPVSPTTNIADQQATIQAQKDEDEYPEKEETVKKGTNGDEEPEDDENPRKMYKTGTDKDEDDELDKDNEDDEDEDATVKAMAKELASLRKQLETTEVNMQKAVQSESENRLRKMGFREEIGLQAPQLTNPLGIDGTTPIVKGNSTGNTVDDLAKLSYSELRNMQAKIEMGQTEGLPREIVGN
jgi:hypothetical protein